MNESSSNLNADAIANHVSANHVSANHTSTNPKQLQPLTRIIACTSMTALYLLILFSLGLGYYADSAQYVEMHFRRDPLYPIYLWLFRTLLGNGNVYLYAAAIVQLLLNCLASDYFARHLSAMLHRGSRFYLLAMAAQAALQLLTVAGSRSHLFLAGSILTESLTLPIFSIFFIKLAEAMLEAPDAPLWNRNCIQSLLLALLAAFTRGQLVAFAGVWALVMLGRILRQMRSLHRKGKPTAKKTARSLLTLVCLLLAFLLLLSGGGRLYRLVFYGKGIRTEKMSYSDMVMSGTVLYVSREEDASYISDPTARELFLRMSRLLEDKHATLEWAPKGLNARTLHFEQNIETLRYDADEDIINQYLLQEAGIEDYITRNEYENYYSGLIWKAILPHRLIPWMGNFLRVLRAGLIRSIGIFHPRANWLFGLLYLLTIIQLITHSIRNRHGEADSASRISADLITHDRLMLLTLLCILLNCVCISLVMPCEQRYCIYGFVPFYLLQADNLLNLMRRMRAS